MVAISDRAWAMFVLRLQDELTGATWKPASSVMAPLRAIKDEAEVEALAKAAAAADRVAAALLGGEIALIGRTERQVSAEITRRLLDEGQRKGQLRHRRLRAQFGQPSSRTVRARHPTGRARRM